jgi:putative FmdB family regulatory protein
MPLFEFYCKRCEKNFEVFLRLSESHEGLICPYCNGEEVIEASDSEGRRPPDDFTSEVCGLKKET